MLLIFIIPSALVGALSGYFIGGKKSYFVAGALPWFGLLACLLYREFYIPHEGGATMWQVAQLFLGTIVAIAGLVSCAVCKGALEPDAQ